MDQKIHSKIYTLKCINTFRITYSRMCIWICIISNSKYINTF